MNRYIEMALFALVLMCTLSSALAAPRIGARVLIPVSDLKGFSRADHPQRLAG